MSAYQVSVLAVRIAGIYVWVHFIHSLPAVLNASRQGFDSYARNQLLSVVLLFFLGLVLIIVAPRIARWVVMGHDNEAADERGAPEAVAFSVVGLLLLVLTLTRLSAVGAVTWARPPDSYAATRFWVGYGAVLLAHALELFLGLWLFFRSHGLVALVRRFQGYALDSPPFREAGDDAPPRADRWQIIAFTTVGLYFFVTGLEGILHWSVGELSQYWLLSYTMYNSRDSELWRWGGTVGFVLRALVGVVLVLRGRTLATWWVRTQHARYVARPS